MKIINPIAKTEHMNTILRKIFFILFTQNPKFKELVYELMVLKTKHVLSEK